jgi:hypothetical protein
MKTAASVTSLVGALVSVQLHGSSAFVAPSSAAPKSSLAAHRQDNTSCDRLTFLKTIATVAVASPLVAFADGGFEDLAMPSADEQKAQDVSPVIIVDGFVSMFSLCCSHQASDIYKTP